MGADLLVEAIELIKDNKVEPKVQDKNLVTFVNLLKRKIAK